MDPYFAEPRCIVHQGTSALARLRALGVPYELLVKAGQQGFIERGNAELPFDPVTAPGTDAWRYPVRVLRSGLVQLGWRIDNPRNLPLVISDDVGINITVSSGDEFTGILGERFPKSKNPKGILTSEAIRRNLKQLDMFPEHLPEAVKLFESTAQYPTYVFLLYITDEEIQAELSRPSSMDDANHVDMWSERILLSVPLPGQELIDDVDFDEGPDILPVVTSKI